MLVLSRKPNESIIIGDNIRITVLNIRGNQIRLGIEAPDWVKIMREELCSPSHVGSAPERVAGDCDDPASTGSARVPGTLYRSW